MDVLKRLIDRASREPVLGFGAIGLSITAWWPQLEDTDAKKAAIAGILLYLQRIFSSSKKSAEEQIAAAKADVDEKVEVGKYVGAVEHQATSIAGRVIGRAARLDPVTAADGADVAAGVEPPTEDEQLEHLQKSGFPPG